VKYKKLLTQ